MPSMILSHHHLSFNAVVVVVVVIPTICTVDPVHQTSKTFDNCIINDFANPEIHMVQLGKYTVGLHDDYS